MHYQNKKETRRQGIASRDAFGEWEERTRQWRSRVALWILLLVVAFWGNILLRDPNFRIARVSVANNHRIPTDDITARVAATLAQPLWRIFPRANLFLARPGIVRTALLDDPRIADAAVERSFLRRELVVTITERTPAFVLEHENIFFLLDGKEGSVIAVVSASTGIDPALLRIRDTTAPSITVGDRALDPLILEALSSIRPAIEQYTPVEETIIGAPSPDALSFRTKEGWSVYVGTGESVTTQRDRLVALLATKLPTNKRKGIEYIDLRFGERVFYK